MTKDLATFKQLTDAEQYFEFFELPYDAKFVNVNRLHILRKFSQYMASVDEAAPDLEDDARLERYKEALQEAYQVFESSTPLDEKLFKVFNQKAAGVVLLSEIGTDS